MIRNTALSTIVLIGALLGWTTTAQANALEIGGKTSLTTTLAITSIDPEGGNNDATLVSIALGGGYTTEDARFELGGSLVIIGLIPSSELNADTGIYNLTGQARINTNPAWAGGECHPLRWCNCGSRHHSQRLARHSGRRGWRFRTEGRC